MRSKTWTICSGHLTLPTQPERLTFATNSSSFCASKFTCAASRGALCSPGNTAPDSAAAEPTSVAVAVISHKAVTCGKAPRVPIPGAEAVMTKSKGHFPRKPEKHWYLGNHKMSPCQPKYPGWWWSSRPRAMGPSENFISTAMLGESLCVQPGAVQSRAARHGHRMNRRAAQLHDARNNKQHCFMSFGFRGCGVWEGVVSWRHH